jgi:hypothetical protein
VRLKAKDLPSRERLVEAIALMLANRTTRPKMMSSGWGIAAKRLSRPSRASPGVTKLKTRRSSGSTRTSPKASKIKVEFEERIFHSRYIRDFVILRCLRIVDPLPFRTR